MGYGSLAPSHSSIVSSAKPNRFWKDSPLESLEIDTGTSGFNLSSVTFRKLGFYDKLFFSHPYSLV